MLVLSRGVDEAIRIGEEITITVLKLKGGGVKLGITAPRELAVHREEVFRRLEREEARSQRHPAGS